ncbi:MAG: hypothetical protein D6741_15520, partial [Planctomycetota bacterium]
MRVISCRLLVLVSALLVLRVHPAVCGESSASPTKAEKAIPAPPEDADVEELLAYLRRLTAPNESSEGDSPTGAARCEAICQTADRLLNEAESPAAVLEALASKFSAARLLQGEDRKAAKALRRATAKQIIEHAKGLVTQGLSLS